MLLPQSHSYKLLSERLATASTLHAHISGSRGMHNLPFSTGVSVSGSDVKRSSSPSPVPTPAINMTSSSTLSALFSHTSSRFPAPNIPSSSSTSPAATGTAATTAPTTTTGTSKALVAAVSIESLVQEFVKVQQTHSQHRKALLHEKSLLFAPSSSSSSAAYNPYDSVTKLISSTDAATTSSLPPLHTTDSSAPTTTTTATANVYKPSNIRSPTPPVDDTTGSLFDKPPLPPGTTSAITAFGFAESDGVPMGGNVGPTGPASGVGSVSGIGGIGKSRSSDALSAAGVVADGADKGQKDSSFISL